MRESARDKAGVIRRKAASIGKFFSAVMVCGVAVAQSSSAVPGNTNAAPPAASRTVTLITGDQVVLNEVGEGDRRSVSVLPRIGREGIVFATTYQRLQDQPERLLVIPADAQPLIDADRLDRMLFDVTTRLESVNRVAAIPKKKDLGRFWHTRRERRALPRLSR